MKSSVACRSSTFLYGLGFAAWLGVAVASPSVVAAVAGGGDPLSKRLRAFRAAEMLENQLRCKENPQPARVVRDMLARGLLKETPYGHDGSPVWTPTMPMKVFGVPVRYVTGWQANTGGDPLKPFSRGPGTIPPWFISVTVTTKPGSGLFPPARAAGPDDPHAAVNDSGADMKPGVELACYGG